ncbi:MAG: hypothetical protein ACW99F_16495 [Candidatus Hodarchaeales archaeon]|jgi:hypothetical protein
MANNENISTDFLRTDEPLQSNEQQNNMPQQDGGQQNTQTEMPQPRQTPRTGDNY